MLARRARAVSRHGVASVELAVLLAFLIPLLLYGLWEVGRMVEVSQILSNACREGARQAATGQLDNGQVDSVVREYIFNEGLNKTNVNVTVTNLGFPGNQAAPDNNPQNATELDRIQVTATIPFADVQWVNFNVFSGPGALLSGSAVWSSMKDRAYPVPVPPPGF